MKCFQFYAITQQSFVEFFILFGEGENLKDCYRKFSNALYSAFEYVRSCPFTLYVMMSSKLI